MIRTRVVTVPCDCRDPVLVWHNFLCVVNALRHVQVLASVKHDFPGGGLTGLVVLAESHAAIHTWPELSLAWCELATCGDPSDCERFEELLSEWAPQES
jgi:S-adenosylmethionine/arginine decarboxylase-like enzyme